MRTKERPLGPPALILAAVFLAFVCAGCASNRQWGTCTTIGAVVGALGGAASGIAIANYTRGSHRAESRTGPTIGAAFGGAAAGAVIGALAGHYLCDPEATETTYQAPAAPMAPPSTIGGSSGAQMQ